MRIILMGPPACGKGTIGALLSEKLHIPVVSVGSLLRAVPETHPFYQKINEPMSAGLLVPNDLAGQILSDELSKPNYSNGFILDGWLRQLSDKDYFDPKPDFVIHIKISDQTAIKRISGRRLCEDDGKIYNIYTLPKEQLAEMQSCNVLVQREDDKEDVVKTRLKSFYDQTLPVIEFFGKTGKLVEIDGEGTPQEVFNLVLAAINDSNQK